MKVKPNPNIGISFILRRRALDGYHDHCVLGLERNGMWSAI